MKRLWAFFAGGEEKAKPAKRAKKATPGPSLADASETLDAKVTAIELKIQKCDAEIRELAGSKAPTAKKRAMQAMQRRKMHEQHRDTLIGQQFNIDTLAMAQDQAESNAMTVQAMEEGQQSLKAQQVDIGEVERLADSLQEQMGEMQEINALLASSATTQSAGEEEQGEMEAEFARMQAEAAQAALLDASLAPAAATSATATSAAASTRPPTVLAPAATAAAGSRASRLVAPASPVVAPAAALQTQPHA